MEPIREHYAPESLGPFSNTHPSAGLEFSVELWDALGRRRAVLLEIIKSAGGIPRIFPGDLPVKLRNRADGSALALVALGGASFPERAILELIARLKSEGVSVIAFEDGVEGWPVRLKCRPLLAGASRLLDSASDHFPAEVHEAVEQALRGRAEMRRQNRELQDLMVEHGIVGDSPAIIAAFGLAIRFSQFSDLSVLITGESGTGKELVARAISRMDPKRSHGPFVAINCAAVQPTLLESEFFGHRRGAFTGAERDRKGWIRAAEGGVLFLDEIGELDLSLQAKLLRVLQEGRVIAVGEEQEVLVSARFIAATNRNLEQLVAEGKFRSDLYHRLRTLVIQMPPLRDRPSDLPRLVEHFVQKQSPLLQKNAPGVSRDFLDALRQSHLPGNIRQLENLIRQSFIKHQYGELGLADLPVDVLHELTNHVEKEVDPFPAMRTHEAHGEATVAVSPEPMDEFVRRIVANQGWNLSEVLCECERHVCHIALQQSKGNQSEAARLLGITSRSVYNKVRKHHLPG